LKIDYIFLLFGILLEGFIITCMINKIITIPVGQMQSNCYIVTDVKTNDCIIIDPGDDGEYIVSKIQEFNLNPKKILATHGHFDHIMAGFFIQHTLNIPFLINSLDKFLVDNMTESASYFLNIQTDPKPIIEGNLSDSQDIQIGSMSFSVIPTPGHTPGSVCLYSKKENLIFTGDLMFADGGVGRTDFSYSDPVQLVESLGKIFKLPKNTVIYPGHGPSTSIKKEQEIRK
jgi:hydroxyacylglutathione hydrolase